MSYDLYFWKSPRRDGLADSATYALIAEDVEATHLEEVDADHVRAALDSAFPGWDRQEEPSFQISFSKYYFSLSLWASTPASIPEWFAEFAADSGLTLFDPQAQAVDERDVVQAESLAKEERRTEHERRWTQEVIALKSKAAAGDAAAQLELGNRYSFGEGVRASANDAAYWYRLAAEKGNHDAMFNLAACYQRGDGLPKDEATALHWYERAFEGDKMMAPFALGEVYMDGIVVARDLEKAKEYFQIALENDHPDAAAALKLLRLGDFSDEAKRKAWKYWTRE